MPSSSDVSSSVSSPLRSGPASDHGVRTLFESYSSDRVSLELVTLAMAPSTSRILTDESVLIDTVEVVDVMSIVSPDAVDATSTVSVGLRPHSHM